MVQFIRIFFLLLTNYIMSYCPIGFLFHASSPKEAKTSDTDDSLIILMLSILYFIVSQISSSTVLAQYTIFWIEWDLPPALHTLPTACTISCADHEGLIRENLGWLPFRSCRDTPTPPERILRIMTLSLSDWKSAIFFSLSKCLKYWAPVIFSADADLLHLVSAMVMPCMY